MKFTLKNILAITATIIYGLPMIHVFCDTGDLYQTMQIFFLINALLFVSALIILLTLCWLPPVWIYLCWHFFGKDKKSQA